MHLSNVKCPKCDFEMLVDTDQKEHVCDECGALFDSNGQAISDQPSADEKPLSKEDAEKQKIKHYNQTQHASSATRALVESGVLIAIAAVLSMLKLARLPYGGSITAASMLPLIIISYRHGVKKGLIAGFVYSLIQLVLGVDNLSYATNWKAAVAIVLLDYIFAFLFLGLGGIFRKKNDNQALSLLGGAILCSVIRYACHVLSGATVWAGLSIPTKDALLFSFAYNATYMLPEAIVLAFSAYYIGSSLDFKAEHPVRIAKKTFSVSKLLYIIAGLIFTAAIVFDTVSVFSKLQNGDTGKWDINGLNLVNWKLMIIVSAVAAAICILFVVVGFIKSKKNKTLDNA